MGKFDIDRPIAELFSVEPYALRIRNVCNSHDIATIRELCLHSNWDLIHSAIWGKGASRTWKKCWAISDCVWA